MIAISFHDIGIGLFCVSLTFRLAVITMALTIGHISGHHINLAVPIGLWTGRRFPTAKLVPYIIA